MTVLSSAIDRASNACIRGRRASLVVGWLSGASFNIDVNRSCIHITAECHIVAVTHSTLTATIDITIVNFCIITSSPTFTGFILAGDTDTSACNIDGGSSHITIYILHFVWPAQGKATGGIPMSLYCHVLSGTINFGFHIFVLIVYYTTCSRSQIVDNTYRCHLTTAIDILLYPTSGYIHQGAYAYTTCKLHRCIGVDKCLVIIFRFYGSCKFSIVGNISIAIATTIDVTVNCWGARRRYCTSRCIPTAAYGNVCMVTGGSELTTAIYIAFDNRCFTTCLTDVDRSSLHLTQLSP